MLAVLPPGKHRGSLIYNESTLLQSHTEPRAHCNTQILPSQAAAQPVGSRLDRCMGLFCPMCRTFALLLSELTPRSSFQGPYGLMSSHLTQQPLPLILFCAFAEVELSVIVQILCEPQHHPEDTHSLLPTSPLSVYC